VERIKLDVWYIEHYASWLDIKILLKTLWVVLVKREGIYGENGRNDPFVSLEEAPRSEQEGKSDG
jgi:hypothetical protein